MSAVAGLCVGLPASWAHAQTQVQAQAQANGLNATERFASQGLNEAVVAGGLIMQADLATVWTQQFAGVTVQRVVLERTVHLEIGGNPFDAERAVMWIRQDPRAAGARQVFAYLENVGSRQGPAGSSAEKLTISGVVTGNVRLVADVVRTAEDVDRAGRQERESLDAITGRADAAMGDYYSPPPREEIRGRRAFSRSGRSPVAWPEPEPRIELADAGDAETTEPATETRPPQRTPSRQGPGRRSGQPPVPGRVVQDDQPRRTGEAPSAQQTATEVPSQGVAAGETLPQPTPGVGEMEPSGGADVPIRREAGAMDSERARAGGQWPPIPAGAQPVPGARVRTTTERRSTVLPESSTADLGTVLVPGQGQLSGDGVLTFSAEDIAIVGSPDGESERTILLSGGVGLELSRARGTQGLTMTAQRAVVFLTPGAIADLGQASQDDVLGVYLEGEAVLQDDRTTQRGSSLYYDTQADRALVLDSVLSTRDPRSGMPLYVRAESVRREGERQFVAERATLANTNFAKPHFSIGAKEVIVERYQREVGDEIVTANRVDARGLTLRGGSAPLLWFPRWVGDPERVPLRGLSFDTSNAEGFAVKTTWDAWVLAGLEPPPGVQTELLIDAYEKRGLGVGSIVKWDRPTFNGEVFGYLLPDDDGVDDLRSGEEFDQDGRLRGLVIAENRWDIDEHWTLRAEGTHISDQRLLEAVFDEDFRNRREFTTRGVLTRRGEQSLFEAEVAHGFDDFLSNEYLLISRGYQVDRLPEIRFTRLTTDPLKDFAPGLLTYNAEVRAGQLGLNFDDVTAAERGLRRNFQSQRVLGVTPGMSAGDRLRAEGYNEKPIWRFDTRHELAMPITFGPDESFHVTPFVVGRLTSYDSEFSGFSPDEEDRNRLWGAAGVRMATTISQIDDTIESRTLDLHRLRHVLEPGITLWHADTTIDQEDLPVYDEEVESIVEGSMVRIGLDQKWQTQRGGIGRWRSVDVFTLRTEWVWSSDDTNEQSPIGRYFEDRPEFSNPGEFYNIEALWQVSDAVGLAGKIVHDIDNRESSYITAGISIDHGGEFYTTFDVRRIEAIDATVLGATASYALTSKYRVYADASYDTVQEDFERIGAGVERSFPNVSLRAIVRHNNVQGDTSFGITLAPTGVPGGGFGFSGIGGQDGSRSVSR